MTLRKALLAATVLALPMAAQAQPVSGLYIGAGAGLNWQPSSSGPLTIAGNTNSFTAKLSTQMGAVALGSIGWGFGNGLRAEVEGNFRTNEAQRFSERQTTGVGAGNLPVSRTGGRVESYGVMVNALYDFNMFAQNIAGVTWTPYLGAGVGYLWTRFSNISTQRPATTTDLIEDRSGAFAFQGIAGASLGLGQFVPGLALTAEYRFLGTLRNTFDVDRTTSAPAAFSTRLNAGQFRQDHNYNHAVLVGLRYNFGVPSLPGQAPAQQVAPAAPTRTFLVFFDFNRADLTDRARQIISEAAETSRRTQTTRIEVAGHADRSGTPQYNQALSQRRAEAVAAELVRRGIARNQIAVQAFGESRPLVPTADGVREPQNRRVEIVLR